MNVEQGAPGADGESPAASGDSGPEEEVRDDTSPGPLLDPVTAARVESADREHPIPGGEPECPQCGKKMVRRVERHPAPHGGASPFRVRLVCMDASCRAWTVYDW